MDKRILQDYLDACELIKETEEDIRNLRKRETVFDKVSGSNPEFPYQVQNFCLSGVVETYLDKDSLEREKELLRKRKRRAEEVKLQVEEFLNTCPLRMQRIIRYKFFEGLPWENVADRMGGKATGESVKKEYQRYLEKSKSLS